MSKKRSKKKSKKKAKSASKAKVKAKSKTRAKARPKAKVKAKPRPKPKPKAQPVSKEVLAPSKASGGPKLAPGELGVHIIYVPDNVAAPDEIVKGHPTPGGLKKAALHTGNPKRTDVVVFSGKPWHSVNGELMAHPHVHHVHADTILTVRRRRNQSVVWWSVRPFTITRLDQEAPQNATYAYPFAATLGEARPEPGEYGDTVYCVRSGVPRPEADDHLFKIHFTINGQPIDPDMFCDGSV